MDLWMKIVLIAVVLVAFGSALWQRHILRHTLHKMNDMLDAAIDGSFTEKTIDESMLSATENKLAGYLAASEVSSRNLVSEKENIKELISDISHRTKTPIANILFYSQLLEEKKLS